MDPLAQLRDIHLPAKVSMWPLAYGWYLTAILGVIALYLLWRGGKHYLDTTLPKRRALSTLAKLRQDYQQHHDAVLLAKQLSTLLRRVALTLSERQYVAGLQGEAWLAFLDQSGSTTQFSQGAGRMLIDAPYQAHANYAVEDVLKLVKVWLKKAKVRPAC